MARTPKRDIRVSDEAWERWKVSAAPGTVSALIHRSVEAAIARDPVERVFADAGMVAVEHMEPLETVRELPKRKLGRTAMCEHRVPPTSYCAKCDV